MKNVLTTLRQRHHRRDNARRSAESRTGSVVIGIGFVASVLLAVAILGTAFFWVSLTRDLPSTSLLPILLNPQNGQLLQPTRLYERSGEQVIGVVAPFDTSRSYIPLGDLPDSLKKATLAALDPDFDSHPGYTLTGLDAPNAHPTLAQRLAADFLLWDEPPSLRRALRERLLAAQITARFGRERVLEWFLNSADYGRHAYGADSASQLYFGKPAASLNAAEAAMLAGVSRTPALNPLDSPQDAQRIRGDMLGLMLIDGWMTPEEAAGAAAIQVEIQPAPPTLSLSPAFTELVLAQMGEQFGANRIARGGLNIITTLDASLQTESACLVQTQIEKLADSESPVNCEATEQLPILPAEVLSANPAASAVIIDPHTGEILALVGETRSGGSQAGLTERRLGGMVNPFIYFAAIARAGQSPASLVWDIPGGLSGSVEPQNVTYRGPVRLRVALASGLFTPAADLLAQLGAGTVARTAQPFGLALPADEKSLLAGDSLASPLDVARALGVFADNGVLAGQVSLSVLRVEGVDHSVWFDGGASQAQAVTTPQLAYLVTDMLRDPVARRFAPGTPSVLDVERPAAVLTGSTADGLDTWTAGYTPERSVAVWLGSEVSVSPAAVQGLWHGLMKAATQDVPPSDWPEPQGIAAAEVCERSGLLPTIYCPETVREVFLEENKPVQYDTLYRSVPINSETGLLATAFTPPELVLDKVFMVIPDQARAWAQTANLDTPPDTFDTIQSFAPDANVNISAPGMFADVRGKVTFTGTADGDNFLFYRLEVGKGINPRRWEVVGDDISSPVTDGALGEWDTSGLNGLYTVRLSVVSVDQVRKVDLVMLTVDNTAPEITIALPQNGEGLKLADYPEITFFPTVTDNDALASVAFYVDEKLLETRVSAPFATRWKAIEGQHTLKVVATDLAGNVSEQSVSFAVNK